MESGSRIVEGNPESEPIKVTVTDLDIGFMSMVGLLIKLGLAAIPAALIVGFIGYFLVLVIGGGMAGR